MKRVSVRVHFIRVGQPTGEYYLHDEQVEDVEIVINLLKIALSRVSRTLDDVDATGVRLSLCDDDGGIISSIEAHEHVVDGGAYDFTVPMLAPDQPNVEASDGESDEWHDAASEWVEVVDVKDAPSGSVQDLVSSDSMTTRWFQKSKDWLETGAKLARNWTFPASIKQQQPLPLFSIQKGNTMSGESWSALMLSHAAMNAALLERNEALNLPVSVVCMAGIFRSGKSFVLNFFLRYLSYAEAVAEGRIKSKADWFAPSHGDGRAEHNHFRWAPGDESVTSGIQVWPRPFILKRSNGEKIAVLLMDTQGTEAPNNTSKEFVGIFALSTMMSSVQIYNIEGKALSTQAIERLHQFTQYGSKALGCDNQAYKDFQSLVVLMRNADGNYGFDYDGTNFVWKALNENSLQNIGKDIASSFDAVSGFRMPHPGEDIHEGLPAQKQTYRHIHKVMSPKFRARLKEFVETLLNPDTLPVKKINGQVITCERLTAYLRKWHEVFNSATLPKPIAVFDANAQLFNQFAVERAVKLYREHFSQAFNLTDAPHTVQGMREIHQSARRDADEMFSAKAIGLDRHKEVHLRKLGHLLEEEYGSFKKENVSRAIPAAKAVYEALWNDFIKQSKQDKQHFHVSKDVVGNRDNDFRSGAIAKFYEFVEDTGDASLNGLLRLEQELKISLLKRKATNAENCYVDRMSVARKKKHPWTRPRLQSAHSDALKAALDVCSMNEEDDDEALSLFRLQNQLSVAKASFIPEEMQVDPADQNSNAWDRGMAKYLRGMQPMCVLYESLYMEPDVFIRENQRFQRAALEEYRARCAGDHQSEECEDSLIEEIARHQVHFEKINSKNWWYHEYKKVSTFVGQAFASFVTFFMTRGMQPPTANPPTAAGSIALGQAVAISTPVITEMP